MIVPWRYQSARGFHIETALEQPAIKGTAVAVAASIIGDFRNFLYLTWKHLNLPDPTPIQYDIGYTIQHGSKRLIVEAFRGVGKSWILSAYACWTLLVDPQKKILVVSASKLRADDFSTFTKRLISEMPELEVLKPRQGQRDSNVAFDVGPSRAAHAPSVKSLGITSQLTGSRADLVLADDVEVPSNAATTALREKLISAVKEFDSLLTPNPDSRVIFLGTPQTEMSLYNERSQNGYTLLVWPARFPTPDQREKYRNTLAPYIADQLDRDPTLAGKPTDPKRFGELDLMQRELSYGRTGFALQFMLDTSLSDANKFPLKLSDLVIMDVPPDVAPINLAWASGPEQVLNDLPNVGLHGDRYHKPMWIHQDMAPYQGKVMTIDPSGRGGDELAFAVVAHLHGRLFLQKWTGLAGGYADNNLELIAKTAKAMSVTTIVVESNFGDGMFTKLLQPHLKKVGHLCAVEEIRHNTQKEKRIIDTIEPVMNQHRLVVDRRVVDDDYRSTENHELRGFFQMTRITKDRGALGKDDRIDVLAMAVAFWSEVLGRDTQEAEKSHHRKLLEDELDKFHLHVLGRSPSGPNASTWCIPDL